MRRDVGRQTRRVRWVGRWMNHRGKEAGKRDEWGTMGGRWVLTKKQVNNKQLVGHRQTDGRIEREDKRDKQTRDSLRRDDRDTDAGMTQTQAKARMETNRTDRRKDIFFSIHQHPTIPSPLALVRTKKTKLTILPLTSPMVPTTLHLWRSPYASCRGRCRSSSRGRMSSMHLPSIRCVTSRPRRTPRASSCATLSTVPALGIHAPCVVPASWRCVCVVRASRAGGRGV